MKKNSTCKEFIKNLPKAELHVHIEGTMEPEQLRFFAKRNNLTLPPDIFNQIGDSYQFSDFNSFVKTYLQATHVLLHEQDFYDLTYAYLTKVYGQGVLHTEIFFDLQTYLPRDISPAIIINGMHRALCDGKKNMGISGFLIMCFIRNLSEEDAFQTLDLLHNFRDKIIGIGLASLETGNPPEKFERVFARARAQGYHLVAHAGEGKTGASMIRQALEKLHVERIDHGVGCMEDPVLVQELVKNKTPLTVCPLSNIAVGCFDKLEHHPLKAMLDAGLMVTINSDDPAFFGGYIADNYLIALEILNLSCNDLITCARNSFIASFLDEHDKQLCLAKLDNYIAGHTC